jgi:hypothetical protein
VGGSDHEPEEDAPGPPPGAEEEETVPRREDGIYDLVD